MTFITRRVTTQLQSIDLAPLAAGTLRAFVAEGRHQGLLDDILRAVDQALKQPETMMEYFGLTSASCSGSTASWTTWPPPKAASGRAANIPAELIVLRNERRLRPSFCIGATPVPVCVFLSGSLCLDG
jgi:hypothetical protein